MKVAIRNLLDLGAITQRKPKLDQFISNIFLTPKSNGSYRFILNLKKLNRFVSNDHFKMEDHRTASKMVPRNGFMATIDLKESYLLVPVARSHRKYLRFQFEDEKLRNYTYEFNALPYGLSSAPRTFTKIMKEVVSYLRHRGFKSVIYLDDVLCLGDTYDECLKNVSETLKLLKCLGFVINFDKSSLHPRQCCNFLGFVYNSIDMSIALPLEKRQKILQLVQKYLNLPICTIREFSRLLGVLTAACPAVRYGWLYTKELERQKYLALKKHQSYEAKFRPSAIILPDLEWWIKNINFTSNPLESQNFVLEIFTDASKTGWGAFCNNERVNGGWKENERNFHINYLELLAVFLGLKCFARDPKYNNCNILLRVDNTTAISYINKMGGIQFPHLTNLTKTIWQWCEKRNIWLFASYINTKDNIEADQESRKINPDIEWNLSDSEYQKVKSFFGEPVIDLFASRTNAKCKLYISWKPDPDAMTVDAFTINWKHIGFFYAFPPFSLILKCIQKIIKDEAIGIIIFPYWPSQPWFPLLHKIRQSNILYLTPDSNISLSSFRTPLLPVRQFTLAAAVLSGLPSSPEELQALR